MREVPDDLAAIEAASASASDRETPVGGGSIFSNNAGAIRGQLPTEEEGDALLDQLLADPGLTPTPGKPAATRSFLVTPSDESEGPSASPIVSASATNSSATGPLSSGSAISASAFASSVTCGRAAPRRCASRSRSGPAPSAWPSGSSTSAAATPTP